MSLKHRLTFGIILAEAAESAAAAAVAVVSWCIIAGSRPAYLYTIPAACPLSSHKHNCGSPLALLLILLLVVNVLLYTLRINKLQYCRVLLCTTALI
jgi:hypothetical protein